MSMDTSEYTRALQREYAAGHTNTYSTRQALKSLIERIEGKPHIENDLTLADAGGPDLVLHKGGLTTGYLLTTDIGADLNTLDERAKSLRAILPNVLLTNYLDVRLLATGQTARLATRRSGQIEPERSTGDALALLRQFTLAAPPHLKSSLELAHYSGTLTARLRDVLISNLTGDAPERNLSTHWETWRAAFADITPQQFADQYAQAIIFGLVAARMRHGGAGRQQPFTLRDAIWDQPSTSPFMRGLFQQVTQFDSRVLWIIEAMATVLSGVDIDAVRADFGRRSRQEEPLGQLYIAFQASYKGSQPIRDMPESLAIYLVSAVHELLHRRFKRVLGVADEAVQITNAAVGSGTLLFFLIQQIYDALRQQQQLGAWDGYVSEDLLPRIAGFESSLAAYAITHLKVSLQLSTTGYRFASNQPLNVCLRPPAGIPPTSKDNPFAELLRQEMRRPEPRLVQVLLGQFDDGQAALDTALRTINAAEGGIAALLLPGDFLDQPAFHPTRTLILRFFSDLYLLRMPDVTIAILLRRPNWQGSFAGRVYYSARNDDTETNLNWLSDHTLGSTSWQELHPHEPDYLLVPSDNQADRLSHYQQGWPIDEIMPVYSIGLEGETPAFSSHDHAVPVLYRPFDLRYMQPQQQLFNLRLHDDNIALCVNGGAVFCTTTLVHQHLLGEQTCLFPLYVYPDTTRLVTDSPFAPGESGRRPNLNANLILRLAEMLDMTFVPDGRGDLKDSFGPLDVFHYLYATFNSPAYRDHYAAFGNNEIPRLPLPDSARQFRGLARAGRDLARLHVLYRADNWPLVSGFHGPGTNRIDSGYPHYVELAGEPGGRIYINREKFFSSVERPLWNMNVGGVQVLREWLTLREGRLLGWRDLHEYQKIIVALARSLEVLNEIDEVYAPD